jgi:DNA-binding NarL/FixJ family response regulator
MAELANKRATPELGLRRVLLVEDSPAHLVICEEALRNQSPHFYITTAQTAREAENYLQNDDFDVIVLDYNLPDMSGPDLIHYVHEIAPNTPIIVVTGDDHPQLSLDILRCGASDYLPKFGEYHKFLPRTISTNMERYRLQDDLKEMYTRMEQSSREESLLNRLIVTIHSSLDLDDIVEKAAQSLFEEVKVSRSIVCLLNDNSGTMRIARQCTNGDLAPVSDRSLIFSKYHDLLLDIGERRPLVVQREDTFALAQDVRSELVTYGILSMIMVPLVYQGRLLGLLHLDNCDDLRLWTSGEISLLQRIANQLAIAISQARLYKIVESQSKNIDKLNDLCTQLNAVVSNTRELTEKQESREKVRVKLSTREIEVLKNVARGLNNKEIAEILHITEGTCEVHVSRLRKKLSLSSRAALVRYAFENHLS